MDDQDCFIQAGKKIELFQGLIGRKEKKPAT